MAGVNRSVTDTTKTSILHLITSGPCSVEASHLKLLVEAAQDERWIWTVAGEKNRCLGHNVSHEWRRQCADEWIANEVSSAVGFWMHLSVTRKLADYYSSSNCDIQLKAPQRALISGCRVDKQPILELGAVCFISRRLV